MCFGDKKMPTDKNGEKLPHRDIAKYDNTLNNVQMNFTAKELDIFWAVATQLTGTNRDYAVFTYDEIMEIIKPKRRSLKELTQNLKSMADELATLRVLQTGKDGMSFVSFSAFPTFEADAENKTLTVEVHERFKPYLNQFATGFTRFSLLEYVNLSSKYSKKLFIHLKQYRTTGLYVVNRDKLYELLGLSKAYRRNASVVDQRVLEPAIEELQKNFKGLKYQKFDKNGHLLEEKGQKVWQYRFTYEPEASDADALAKERAQIKNQLSIASQKLAEAKDSKEFEYQLQYVKTLSKKYESLSDGLENILDLENVKVTDEQGNDITDDDNPVNSDEGFTWELSDSMPSEKYKLNVTAEKDNRLAKIQKLLETEENKNE